MPACIAARLIRLNYDLYVKASEYRPCFAADVPWRAAHLIEATPRL